MLYLLHILFLLCFKFQRFFFYSWSEQLERCQPDSLCAGLWVERSGFKTRLGHFVMFLGKTLYSHHAPLHPGVEMGNGELSGKPDGMLGGNVVMEWHPIRGGGGEW